MSHQAADRMISGIRNAMRKFAAIALTALALIGGVAAVASFETRPALACGNGNC
jgi:hypothetical protein